MLVNFIIERLGASISNLSADLQTAISQRLPHQAITRSTLILCGIGLRAQAKNYHVCNLAYCALQNNMRPEDLQLLLTYITPPTEPDMPPFTQQAVTSWPLPTIKMNEDPEKSALSTLVGEYLKKTIGTRSETRDSDTDSQETV